MPVWFALNEFEGAAIARARRAVSLASCTAWLSLIALAGWISSVSWRGDQNRLTLTLRVTQREQPLLRRTPTMLDHFLAMLKTEGLAGGSYTRVDHMTHPDMDEGRGNGTKVVLLGYLELHPTTKNKRRVGIFSIGASLLNYDPYQTVRGKEGS